MHIAINTSSLNEDTRAALSQARALGFDFVEVNLHPAEFGYDYRRKPGARFYRDVKAQLDELGLRVWSTTAVPLNQAQMFFERARKDVLVGGAIAAGILGSRVFVTEPADLFTSEIAFNSYFEEQGVAPVIEGYDEAWVQAANRRVTLALRNIDYWLGIVLTNQADRMHRVTHDLAIGSALDVPLARHRNALHRWLEVLADRLAVAYVYDTDQEGHVLAPRDAGWQEWLPALANSPLKCVVMRAGPGQTPEEISAARAYLQEILA